MTNQPLKHTPYENLFLLPRLVREKRTIQIVNSHDELMSAVKSTLAYMNGDYVSDEESLIEVLTNALKSAGEEV